MPKDLAPSEGHFPGLQMIMFLLYPHMAGEEEVEEREKENTLLFFSPLLIRTFTVPSRGLHSFPHLNLIPPKGPASTYHHTGVQVFNI